MKKEVTFTEIFAHSLKLKLNSGFTLAEVLITLGIIGVVAAIVLPTIIANITERVNSSRQANIAYKITQATDKMKALGLLNGSYNSTDEFVDELQKHLKIAKRCDANHIADCWPTEKVMTSDGEEFDVSEAKTGKNLNIKGNNSNNVGLVLADGASIILTYNQDSQGVDIGDEIKASDKDLPIGFGKFQKFAYTTDTTGAIDFVMDVNGRKGPNSEKIGDKEKDIRSFKVAQFSTGCAGLKIPGIGCTVYLGTSYECISEEPYTNNDNCWAGAKKACNDIGMTLPNEGTLKNIYNKSKEYPNLPKINYYLWSSTESSWSKSSALGIYRNYNSFYEPKGNRFEVLCVGN